MRKRQLFRYISNVVSAVIITLLTTFLALGQSVVCKRQATLMGSRFDITIVANDSMSANTHIEQVIAEVKRIEHLISEWDSTTQISEVNRQAGIKPVTVDREVFELTARAIQYSKLTDGAFDISIAALDRIWVFDGSMTTLPSEVAIQNSIRNVGYQHIQLDSLNSTIYLTKPGMKIGFGSIGKGYAADRGRLLMQQAGVKAGIVNASGDLSAWGSEPNGKVWKIGITHPFKAHKLLKILKLRDEQSVATSGSYEKYVEIDGKRYAHIINPTTGYPSTGLTSVTVIGPTAEIANMLSTSVIVLGAKRGRKLLQQHTNYQSIIITDQGKVRKSK